MLNEQGNPIEFRDHLFLFDIYRDFSPKQVILKAAQIGFSTLAILKTMWLAKYRKMDLIYTLPTGADVNDFVSGKVNRMINANPILQEWVHDKDSIGQKHVEKNVIYYRGTFTERAALMVSADLVVMDEEDRSKQDVLQQYASRLQHSEYKWEWHFSNPSVEGNGVSRYWPLSDQKHWFVKCGKCNVEQYLDWPESICMERRVFQCKKCHAELSDNDRRAGRWVQKVKDKEYSGYWISLLMAPWTRATEIIDKHENKSAEFFANFVLGLPYIGEGNLVTPDVILQNCTHAINTQENVVIGCDSGIKKHYVCGNKQGLFYYGVTEDWADIARLLQRFKRSVLVVDAMPDITGPRKLCEAFPGRVFLNHYARDRKTMQLIRWGKEKEEGNVLADRNRLLQLVIDEFADRRIPLQGTKDDWMAFYSHWKTLYKVVSEDSLGVPTFSWESSTGMDHWAHATAYWRIGMDRFGHDLGSVTVSSLIDVEHGSPTVDAHGSVSADDVMRFVRERAQEQESDWRT